MTPRIAAERLAAILQRHGLSVSCHASSLSSSRYLDVTRWDADGECIGTVKVRLSTHEARPTYERLNGAADIEVGTHAQAHTDNPSDGAGRILRRLGIEPDKRLVPVLARLRAEQEAAEAPAQAAHQAWLERMHADEAETACLDAILIARGLDRATLGGKRWREKRAALRREQRIAGAVRG